MKASSASGVSSNRINIDVKKEKGTLNVWYEYQIENAKNRPSNWSIAIKDGEEEIGTLDESNKSVKKGFSKDLVVGNHNITLVSDNNLAHYNVVFSHPNGVDINRGRTTYTKVTISEIPVESIALKNASNQLIVGDALALEAEVTPTNATDSSVKLRQHPYLIRR